MNYQDYLKNANRAVDAAFKEIIHEAEKPPYWRNFNSKSWYDKLDQDEQAVQEFLDFK